MRRVVVLHAGPADQPALDWGLQMQLADPSVELVVLHRHSLPVGFVGSPPATARAVLNEAGVPFVHDELVDAGADPERLTTVSSGRTLEEQFADFGDGASVVLIGADPKPRWPWATRRSERLRAELGVHVLVAGVDRVDGVAESSTQELQPS